MSPIYILGTIDRVREILLGENVFIGYGPGQLNGLHYDVNLDMNFINILIVLWQNEPMNQHTNTFIKVEYKARMIKCDYPVTFALFQYADRLSSVAWTL